MRTQDAAGLLAVFDAVYSPGGSKYLCTNTCSSLGGTQLNPRIKRITFNGTGIRERGIQVTTVFKVLASKVHIRSTWPTWTNLLVCRQPNTPRSAVSGVAVEVGDKGRGPPFEEVTCCIECIGLAEISCV